MSDETPMEDINYTKPNGDVLDASTSIHSIVNKLARKRCLPDDNSSIGCEDMNVQDINHSDFERKLSLDAVTNSKPDNIYAEEDVGGSTPSRDSSPTGIDRVQGDGFRNSQTANADNVIENTSKRKSSRPCKYEAPAKKMSATLSSMSSSTGREADTYTEDFNCGDPQSYMNNRKYTSYAQNEYLPDMQVYNGDREEFLFSRGAHVNSGRLASRIKLKRAKSTIKGPVSCIVRKLLAEMANSVASVVDIECNIYKRAGRRPKLWTSSVAHFSSHDYELMTSMNTDEASNCFDSLSEFSKQFITYETSEGGSGMSPSSKMDLSSPFSPLQQKRRRGRPSRKDKMEEMFLRELWQVMDALLHQVCMEIDGADLSYQDEASSQMMNTAQYFAAALNGANGGTQLFDAHVQTPRGRGFQTRRSRCRSRLSNGFGPRMPASTLQGKRSTEVDSQSPLIGNLFNAAQLNILNALLPLMQITNGQIDGNVLRQIIGDGLANLNQPSSIEQATANNTTEPVRVDQIPFQIQQTIPEALSSVALKFQNTIATAAIIAASQAAASLARASDPYHRQPISGQNGPVDLFQHGIRQAYSSQYGLDTSRNSFLPQPLEAIPPCRNTSPSSNTDIHPDPAIHTPRVTFEAVPSQVTQTDDSNVIYPLNLSALANVSFNDALGVLQTPDCYGHRGTCRGKRRGRSRFTQSLTHEDLADRNNLFSAIHRLHMDSVDTRLCQRGVHSPRRRNSVGRPPGSRKSRLPRRTNDDNGQ